MDVNRLFSVQSNGYNINEVDDYVTFIQTELTKNMKLSHDIEMQKASLNDNIKKLESENKMLNDKNQKLYRDCVAFAKRLKALEVYNNSPEFEPSATSDNANSQLLSELKEAYNLLLRENQNLKSELADLKAPVSEFKVLDSLDDDNNVVTTPFTETDLNEYNELEVQEFVEDKNIFSGSACTDGLSSLKTTDKSEDVKNKSQEELAEEVLDEVLVFEEQPADSKINETEEIKSINDVANKSKAKSEISSQPKRKVGRKIMNFIASLLLIVSIITGIISIIAYVFVKTPDMNIMGYRPYTLHNDNAKLGYSTNDVLITNYVTPNDVKSGKSIVYVDNETSKRNVSVVESSEVVNGNLHFKVKNNVDESNTITIDSSSYKGTVKFKVPLLGAIAKYAFTSPYDYIAILACVLLLSIFLKIVFYLDITKERKYKFEDYEPSDFTLDI